jgi:cell division protein FtsL
MLVIGVTITASIYLYNFEAFKSVYTVERHLKEIDEKIAKFEKRLKEAEVNIVEISNEITLSKGKE